MHPVQQQFCESVKARFPELFVRSRVLDIGSMDINGTNRYLFEEPLTYVGVDLAQGPGVDIVCLGHDYSPPFGSVEEQVGFDVVISTECFEHNPYWQQTFARMVQLTRPGGLVVMTCAGMGRHPHGTSAHTPEASPGSIEQFGDYYANLGLAQFSQLGAIIDQQFGEWELSYHPACDLRFWGRKR